MNPVSGGPLGNTEDEHSVGSHVTFGRFRALYLADFPWNKEFELMCPNNRLGTVDFLLVSRHGQHSSNSEALVHALRPRVGVINNGIRKGGQPETMRVLHAAPGAGRSLAASRRAVERGGIRRFRGCSSPNVGRIRSTARRTGSKCRRRPTERSR